MRPHRHHNPGDGGTPDMTEVKLPTFWTARRAGCGDGFMLALIDDTDDEWLSPGDWEFSLLVHIGKGATLSSEIIAVCVEGSPRSLREVIRTMPGSPVFRLGDRTVSALRELGMTVHLPADVPDDRNTGRTTGQSHASRTSDN
jgi:hypothetical protein